ncbi:MFS transporter [Streptomyces mirabilis]|uniref:MFS transporter n=1 Tax=Streptomyces mirabilis TaxID=68239 RepID=UPI003F4B0D25
MGARQAFGAGLALFLVASAACGFAPTPPVLVVARLVQGAGAAVMMPATLAMIREAYPDAARRTRAIAIWAVGGSVGSAAGPLLGGALSAITPRPAAATGLSTARVISPNATNSSSSSPWASPCSPWERPPPNARSTWRS